MPYTIDPSSADCYPCTSVRIKKFDLRCQQELDRVEAVLVTAKAAQWEESPLCSTFDFEHYKAIHRHLFCDLYEWAGVPRSINISKKGTQFCPADEIPRVSSAIFRRLAEQNFFQSLSFDDFVDAFVASISARTSANDTPPAFAPAFNAFFISRFLSPSIVFPHHNLANVLKMFFKMFIQNNP